MIYRMMNYPESLVSHYTGVRQTAQCETILSRMYDTCGDLGGLDKEQFKQAAILAARELKIQCSTS